MTLSKGTEIPPNFALWCGISTLATALGRKVWLDRGVFVLYPNFYIILVAASGKCRKGTSIRQALKILNNLQPRPNFIAQKLTPEALIDALGGHETLDDKVVKTPNKSATGIIVAEELATFLNKRSYEQGLGELLTDLFDCPQEWLYHTKGGGKLFLNNVCINILSASTPDWLRDAIPQSAIGGGLTSRVIFV